VLVCVHDPVVEGLGPIDQLRLSALDDEARSRLLTLEGFLDHLDDADPTRSVTGVHLDLKDVGYEIDAVDAVLARRRRLFATTSIANSIALIRRERPDVDAFLTIGTSKAGLSGFALARLRLHERFPMRQIRRTRATGIAVHHALATPSLRRWCQRRGLSVVVWTVDRDDRLEQWLDSDVDVVTTNRPLFALERRRVRGRSPGA